jgi:hypothetical protein
MATAPMATSEHAALEPSSLANRKTGHPTASLLLKTATSVLLLQTPQMLSGSDMNAPWSNTVGLVAFLCLCQARVAVGGRNRRRIGGLFGANVRLWPYLRFSCGTEKAPLLPQTLICRI